MVTVAERAQELYDKLEKAWSDAARQASAEVRRRFHHNRMLHHLQGMSRAHLKFQDARAERHAKSAMRHAKAGGHMDEFNRIMDRYSSF